MKITVPELERRFCRRVLLRAGCGIKATKTVLRGMVPAVLLLGPLLFWATLRTERSFGAN